MREAPDVSEARLTSFPPRPDLAPGVPENASSVRHTAQLPVRQRTARTAPGPPHIINPTQQGQRQVTQKSQSSKAHTSQIVRKLRQRARQREPKIGETYLENPQAHAYFFLAPASKDLGNTAKGCLARIDGEVIPKL